MKEKHRILKKVIFEIFQDMYFMFVEEGETIPPRGSRIVFSIQLQGDTDTTEKMVFYFSRSLAEQMSMDFLGVDPSELSTHLISETVKECTNVIAGNYLNRGGTTDRLGIPQRIPEGEEQDPENLDEAHTLIFQVTGHPLLVHMSE